MNTTNYFTTALDMAERHLPALTDLFNTANLTANSRIPYKLGQMQEVLDATYGGGYVITCDNNTAGQLMLSQVEFCLSHKTMELCDCRL